MILLKRLNFIIVASVLILVSCTTTSTGIFSKGTHHERYGKKLADAGLKETGLGTLWFSAANRALSNPITVTLPHKEVGYFPADKPRAVGLRFSAKRGEKLSFELERKSSSGFIIYTDLWQIKNDGTTSLLQSIDTVEKKFTYEVEETGQYLLRMQPELLRSGEYVLSVSVGASLAFPVAGSVSRIGSIWGDVRDAGARSHEGIDIFAPKRTPVVAAAAGIVTRVNEGGIGGKVVWLRPKGKNYTLYYAHLDEQVVATGQEVNSGDTVGLVGNTGNARTTPSHLHFGIYAVGGAVDPLPFVNPTAKTPTNVAITSKLNDPLRLNSTFKLTTEHQQNIAYKVYTLVFPLAVTTKEYRVEFPDGVVSRVPISALQPATRAIKQGKLKGNELYVYELPNINSARKSAMSNATSVNIYAYYNDFAYIKTEDQKEGWLPVSSML